MLDPVPIPGIDGASTAIDALDENEDRDLLEKMDDDELFLIDWFIILELLAEDTWVGLLVDFDEAIALSPAVGTAHI